MAPVSRHQKKTDTSRIAPARQRAHEPRRDAAAVQAVGSFLDAFQPPSSEAPNFDTATAPLGDHAMEGASDDAYENYSNALRQKAFSDVDLQTIKRAEHVYVAGFSSQGGGHTERMFKPLHVAANTPKALDNERMVITKKDVIVLALPPHWQVDTGNEHDQLANYKSKYESSGIKVITVQTDKAVLGFYKKEGPSDNNAILKNFVEKPFRNNEQVPLFGPARGTQVQFGKAYLHKAIMQQVVAAVGNPKKITVFEDMDPYLAKAAVLAGVPRNQIIGQTNHLLLMDAKKFFGTKRDAFLVKANGNGYEGNVATVQFSDQVNTTEKLGESFDKLGIASDHSASAVRQQMVEKLLDHGKKFDLNSTEPVPISGCVLVSPQATANTIDRGVYLYLNMYTNPLGQHIRKRLGREGTADQIAAYERTIFVVCGAGTFGDMKDKPNALHVCQAANFDAVTAAGMGFMTEQHYLLSNGYQGNLLLMPVEDQHEQQANAFELMPQALGTDLKTRVQAAKNIRELQEKLDDLVTYKATTTGNLGASTMETVHKATHKTLPKATDKAVERIDASGGMTSAESKLLDENNKSAFSPDRKAARRINKAMWPALTALSKGEVNVTLRMTLKARTQTMPITELLAQLSDWKKANVLLDADCSHEDTKQLLSECTQLLTRITAITDADASKAEALRVLEGLYANETFILGY